jgi:hypothetical protein
MPAKLLALSHPALTYNVSASTLLTGTLATSQLGDLVATFALTYVPSPLLPFAKVTVDIHVMGFFLSNFFW